jgi:hypothetical protein
MKFVSLLVSNEIDVKEFKMSFEKEFPSPDSCSKLFTQTFNDSLKALGIKEINFAPKNPAASDISILISNLMLDNSSIMHWSRYINTGKTEFIH